MVRSSVPIRRPPHARHRTNRQYEAQLGNGGTVSGSAGHSVPGYTVRLVNGPAVVRDAPKWAASETPAEWRGLGPA